MITATTLAIFQDLEIGKSGRRSTASTLPGAEVDVDVFVKGCSFMAVLSTK
jgi:hypothetical protein